ncbi:MAG: hypothetical protein ACOYN6_00105 [Ignavibacteria bacterium]
MVSIKKPAKRRKYPVYDNDLSEFKLEVTGGLNDINIKCTNCGAQWSPNIQSEGGLPRKWWLCNNCGIQRKIVNGGK